MAEEKTAESRPVLKILPNGEEYVFDNYGKLCFPTGVRVFRPPTAFMCWRHEMLSMLRNGTVELPDDMRSLGRKQRWLAKTWASMSEEERRPWVDRTEPDRMLFAADEAALRAWLSERAQPKARGGSGAPPDS
jgi:hypothetical protein